MQRLNNFFNSLTGNNINKKNPQGETRLYIAAREGNKADVRRLLHEGADPNIPDANGLYPLHQAAYWGETEIVDLLLKAGANVNADNGRGWTPLHSAALAGGMKSRKNVIDKLSAAGARTDIGDKYGWTARDYIDIWAGGSDAAGKLRQRKTPHARDFRQDPHAELDNKPPVPPAGAGKSGGTAPPPPR